MSYRILTLNEKKEWSISLEKLPVDQQDIYYTPEYYELYEKNGDGQAMCFVFEKDNDIALYPFLISSSGLWPAKICQCKFGLFLLE